MNLVQTLDRNRSFIMQRSTRIVMFSTCSCILLASVLIAYAGSLTPPAGPIAPTMKTLAEIEPRTPIGPTTTPGGPNSLYRITQPGSYYLTGNVQGVAAKAGIEIVASQVTIDMHGFELVGAAGSLAGIDMNNGGAGNLFG